MPKLWIQDLSASGDHQGKTVCENCHKAFPNDEVKYGARSCIGPFKHYCKVCAKKLGILDMEEFDPSNQNYFGVDY